MHTVLPLPPDWLERFDITILERLCIMTVDGGLTDEEALKALNLNTPVAVVETAEAQGDLF